MSDLSFEHRKIENIPPLVAYKWSPQVVDEGFIPFPKRLNRCLSRVFVEVKDIQVILAVVDYARPQASRPPSYDFLAFIAGMDVPEFKDRIGRMEKRGWVKTAGSDDAIRIKIDGLLDEIEKLTRDQPSASAEEDESKPF